ncbi:hypothetical protein M422DRAFT_105871, partial [Sphaerobolus stellatus SS14]
LPIEIIENILSDMDSPADLLHLALTCKVLHDIIIPLHLHYRELNISMHPDPIELWHGLIVETHLARRFRVFIGSEENKDARYPEMLIQ